MSDDNPGSSVQDAPAAQPGPIPSSSTASSSSATPAPGVAPLASSSSSSPPLHAQAVRFLTSLRHHSPNASVEAQRDFLKAKGLDETAIDAAFQDAARPSSLGLSSASTSTSSSGSQSGSFAGEEGALSEEAAFDQASRAFDDPIHVAGPVLPAKNYPRSPLALYYEEAQGRVDEAARRQETTRRYQVLLGFFRSLSWMLTFGGGLAALGVLAYRLYVMPKLVTMLDSRSFVLKHHHSLWNHVVRSVRNLSQASLAPPRPTQSAVKEETEKAEDGTRRRRSSLKKVQFADEVKGGSLEQREGEDPASPPENTTQLGGKDTDVVLPGTDVVVSTTTKKSSGEEEKSFEEEGAEEAVEPIDVSEPLRASLAALTQRLRGQTGDVDQASLTSSPTAAASSTGGSKSATVADDEEASSSDSSWQDDLDSEEEELELDPFAAPVKKGGKRRGSHKKKKTTATSDKSALSAQPSSTTSSSLNDSSASSSALYDTLVDLNSSISARILHSQTRSFRTSHTGGAYGTFNFAQNFPSSSTASGAGESKEGEGDTVMETSAQIRAEIRSLKGLLLSRRNFPRPNGTAPRPPAPPSFST
ncbi:hypothetical protein BCV69DRAFT_284079 [Microstroma glucosiphilum]|uniref:Peroxin-14 n=1 Tax=Pseudomicrostroma glucosiphilum TaxID=1684307 RepID=A0A316U4Q6_9BASI|nr:hypothetical protein BCV69DRAFT_284079 [Pseudomicrostroma glucosiphilum]PWN19451.1 hypothetical protein BCV69DRAFT_284079 [Pseudomicrostroma glucosiphilum]